MRRLLLHVSFSELFLTIGILLVLNVGEATTPQRKKSVHIDYVKYWGVDCNKLSSWKLARSCNAAKEVEVEDDSEEIDSMEELSSEETENQDTPSNDPYETGEIYRWRQEKAHVWKVDKVWFKSQVDKYLEYKRLQNEKNATQNPLPS